MNWGNHVCKIGTNENYDVSEPKKNIDAQKKLIEPWLSAVFQSEHLALLLGSGFTTAVAFKAGASSAGMIPNYEGFPHQDKLKKAANDAAEKMGRGEGNIEDQIRVANILAQGLEILGDPKADEIKSALSQLIQNFLESIAETERGIKSSVEKIATKALVNTPENIDAPPENDDTDTIIVLVSFLLSFSSRTASRERLNIFTTNYDRLIEYGADLAGLHLLDRFVGSLEPIFRSSRLDIDMHYNPPGIRGEPRYLEGVVRFTKLHGSLDWQYRNGYVRKVGLPFGPDHNHPAINNDSADTIMIYPNAAKDRETSEYPYVELFRDYAAAICRPNSVLVTYGYGFGDEHINRTIADMLTIPSTHLVIIAFNDTSGRIKKFIKDIGRKAQMTLLIGDHFGDMTTLVENYLPKPAIDKITMRQTELLRNREGKPDVRTDGTEQLSATADVVNSENSSDTNNEAWRDV